MRAGLELAHGMPVEGLDGFGMAEEWRLEDWHPLPPLVRVPRAAPQLCRRPTPPPHILKTTARATGRHLLLRHLQVRRLQELRWQRGARRRRRGAGDWAVGAAVA
eukprot:363145-Chlamydomonas_euryale.AAC.16